MPSQDRLAQLGSVSGALVAGEAAPGCGSPAIRNSGKSAGTCALQKIGLVNPSSQ
jgi:hypothetical protein